MATELYDAHDQDSQKKVKWTEAEDAVLRPIVEEQLTYQEKPNWEAVHTRFLRFQALRGSRIIRSSKSCRLRWENQLKPDIDHEEFSAEEVQNIIRMQSLYGNKWAKIAKELTARAPAKIQRRIQAGEIPALPPGQLYPFRRTDNMVKNYWHQRHEHVSRGTKRARGTKRKAEEAALCTEDNAEEGEAPQQGMTGYSPSQGEVIAPAGGSPPYQEYPMASAGRPYLMAPADSPSPSQGHNTSPAVPAGIFYPAQDRPAAPAGSYRSLLADAMTPAGSYAFQGHAGSAGFADPLANPGAKILPPANKAKKQRRDPQPLHQSATAGQQAPLPHMPAGAGQGYSLPVEGQSAPLDVSGAAELQELERNLSILAEDDLTEEDWASGLAIIAVAAAEAADAPQTVEAAVTQPEPPREMETRELTDPCASGQDLDELPIPLLDSQPPCLSDEDVAYFMERTAALMPELWGPDKLQC